MKFSLFNLEWSGKKKDEPIEVNPLVSENENQSQEKIILEVIERWAEKQPFKTSDNDYLEGLPTIGSRSSINETSDGLIPGLRDVLQGDFPFELLRTLENAAMFNRHISYAVENIVTMASTEFEVEFFDVSDQMQTEMRQELKRAWKSWYEHSDGINSLINDLFIQVAVYGCISAESVPAPELDRIKKVVRVSPYFIRFSYDREQDIHIPLQALSSIYNDRLGESTKYPGHIELNTKTYFYSALRRITNKPYGVPPFITAIEDLLTEADMVQSLRTMMKKLGMLGFLSVLLKAPQKKTNEDDGVYAGRVLDYLEKHRPQVEQGFSKGVTIGVKDAHEFELQGQNLNVQGADGLMKIVHMLIFSGVKQDPNLHGHNFSTTESFGRVIMTKMQTQISNYQDLVASFLDHTFLLHLRLCGFPITDLKTRFAKANVSDDLKEQQAENIKLKNIAFKQDRGWIDQNTAAQEAGYNEPAADGPIRETSTKVDDNEEKNEDTSLSITKKKSL